MNDKKEMSKLKQPLHFFRRLEQQIAPVRTHVSFNLLETRLDRARPTNRIASGRVATRRLLGNLRLVLLKFNKRNAADATPFLLHSSEVKVHVES
jgi:hypothetical protein